MIFIIFILVILFIYSEFKFRNNRNEYREISNIHRIFIPQACLVLDKFKIFESLTISKKSFERVGIDKKSYLLKSVIFGIEVFIISLILIIAMNFSDNKILNNRISRPNYKGVTKEKEIFFSTSENNKGKISVKVEKQKLDERAIKKKKEKIREYILGRLLNKNKDIDNISSKLDFFDYINEIDANISWMYDSKYINYDGSLNPKYKDDVNTKIIAHINTLVGYNYDETFYIKILHTNNIERELEKGIKKYDKYVMLPDNFDGKKIVWNKDKEEKPYLKVLLGLIAGIFVIILSLKKVSNKYDVRKFEIKKSYTELVTMLVLYMDTGLSISQAWNKICESDNYNSYLKTELTKTKIAIKNGKHLDEVFNDFANDCDVKEYRRLAQLITQNLKKGSNTILEVLRQELIHNEKDRMNLAKMVAKKAELKLIVPLLIMMLVVFIVVLAPSLLTLNM